jgi:hypothetical protein
MTMVFLLSLLTGLPDEDLPFPLRDFRTRHTASKNTRLMSRHTVSKNTCLMSSHTVSKNTCLMSRHTVNRNNCLINHCSLTASTQLRCDKLWYNTLCFYSYVNTTQFGHIKHTIQYKTGMHICKRLHNVSVQQTPRTDSRNKNEKVPSATLLYC